MRTCEMGFDGECYHLYIDGNWSESSVKFSDIKESAEEAGFEVRVEYNEDGIPVSKPECVYKGK